MSNRNLAAIDLGTNSFHLIVVRVNQENNFEIIDREKEVIRLGFNSTPDNQMIHDNAMERAIKTLRHFKKIADSYSAPIRAVATSAVREASNKNEFIKRALNEADIEVEIISGIEEARLIYLGALNALPIKDKITLCLDIGGGSTEFVVGQGGDILYADSVKVGAVRLARLFFPDFILTESAIERCREYVINEITDTIKETQKNNFTVCVGTSGTIMAAALMIYNKKKSAAPPIQILNNYTFTATELDDITQLVLNNKTLKTRRKIPGLDANRADIIPSGLIILHTIIDLLNIPTITVSGFSLREGVILDTLLKNS